MTADPALTGLHPDDARALAALPHQARTVNGVPDRATAAARARAAQELTRLLGDVGPHELRVSPLGPAWSSDFDLHLATPPTDVLRSAGWIDVSALLATLGHRDVTRWAIVDGHEVLGAVDIHTTRPPGQVDRILQRARERGEVRLREVLELRVLSRAGVNLPTDPVVVAAAGAEAGLPGRPLLAQWSDGVVRSLPAEVPTPRRTVRRLRRRAGRVRASVRRRSVLALGGVDGAGKSTVARTVLRGLHRAGVPCGSVWARPGMNIGWLERLAEALKRGSGTATEPGVRAVARGESAPPRSRRGPTGWAWATLITLAYLADSTRQHLAARGVVVYDRHLMDALVTLDFVYEGVDLRLQRRLVRLALPRARWTYFLDVPADVATRRKPGDTFGAHAVERQLELYERRLPHIPGVVVFDGRGDPDGTALSIFRRIAGQGSVGGGA